MAFTILAGMLGASALGWRIPGEPTLTPLPEEHGRDHSLDLVRARHLEDKRHLEDDCGGDIYGGSCGWFTDKTDCWVMCARSTTSRHRSPV